MDDLDRARLQDFYDELERFRAVFARAQALVAPMIGEDAGRLEAMGKAIRKLYGDAVEPLMVHVDAVLQQAKRMTEPLPENPLHRALERRSGGDRRRADRPVIGPSFRAPAPSATPPPLPVVPLPAPDREADLPTLRTRALPHREIPVAVHRPRPTPAMPTVTRAIEETRVETRVPTRAVEPPRPPSVAPATVPAIRREPPRSPEPELRITFEDPGSWGVL